MSELYFSEKQKEHIEREIKKAEMGSTAEVQVHLDDYCADSALDRASEVFVTLNMHKTRHRNAVLIYLALEDHKFAIIGDTGINAVLHPDFWEVTKEKMQAEFKEGKILQGICLGIRSVGSAFRQHFPNDNPPLNELSDRISFGTE